MNFIDFMKLKGSRSFQQTADLRRTGGFKKSPLRSCVKVAVCNWAPDVHRMYDCHVLQSLWSHVRVASKNG